MHLFVIVVRHRHFPLSVFVFPNRFLFSLSLPLLFRGIFNASFISCLEAEKWFIDSLLEVKNCMQSCLKSKNTLNASFAWHLSNKQQYWQKTTNNTWNCEIENIFSEIYLFTSNKNWTMRICCDRFEMLINPMWFAKKISLLTSYLSFLIWILLT